MQPFCIHYIWANRNIGKQLLPLNIRDEAPGPRPASHDIRLLIWATAAPFGTTQRIASTLSTVWFWLCYVYSLGCLHSQKSWESIFCMHLIYPHMHLNRTEILQHVISRKYFNTWIHSPIANCSRRLHFKTRARQKYWERSIRQWPSFMW